MFLCSYKAVNITADVTVSKRLGHRKVGRLIDFCILLHRASENMLQSTVNIFIICAKVCAVKHERSLLMITRRLAPSVTFRDESRNDGSLFTRLKMFGLSICQESPPLSGTPFPFKV